LALLSRIPEPAVERAARTLFGLCERWEWAPKEEHKELAHMMIQEVGVDVVAKRVLWVKVRPDYEPLFALLYGLRQDGELRYLSEHLEAKKDNCDTEADTGQAKAGVETLPKIFHNSLTSAKEFVLRKVSN
jgi:hypothetical protein